MIAVRLCAAGLLALALSGCATQAAPSPALPPTSLPVAHVAPVTPTAECPYVPEYGFYDVWQNEEFRPRLGCAVEPATGISGTEVYWCCGIHSMWIQQQTAFIALLEEHQPVERAEWGYIPDGSGLPTLAQLVTPVWPGTPTPLPPTPVAPGMPTPLPTVVLMQWPGGRCFEPSGRHAWLTRQSPWEGTCNVEASSGETPFEGSLEQFEGGWLLWNGTQCFVLWNDGTFSWCGGNSKK